MRIIIVFLLVPVIAAMTGEIKYKFVGVNKCKRCHYTREDGRQYDIWRDSKHAEAYRTLTTGRADDIAKEKGLKKPAAESYECLQCHAITTDEKFRDDGVQCESCHGAGLEYKSNSVMRNKAKAIAAGMTEFKDDAAIEKSCRSCHNEKSPTYRSFDFKSMWGDIKHPVLGE